MSKQPNISVAVITYNQQATIRQTLDSIVAQQGDFSLEVVIGEDCSTDDTHVICEEYEARYTTIKLLSNSHRPEETSETTGLFLGASRGRCSLYIGLSVLCAAQ